MRVEVQREGKGGRYSLSIPFWLIGASLCIK
jgi:hypothetical protein